MSKMYILQLDYWRFSHIVYSTEAQGGYVDEQEINCIKRTIGKLFMVQLLFNLFLCEIILTLTDKFLNSKWNAFTTIFCVTEKTKWPRILM